VAVPALRFEFHNVTGFFLSYSTEVKHIGRFGVLKKNATWYLLDIFLVPNTM
jgi:hypothetical protein